MINYKQFVQDGRSMLIAPAGYGKTFTIAECLKHTNGKQLILTHTHAGVSSIKAKLKSADIPSGSYTVETITSFAQRYVMAFLNDEIPSQSSTKEYYPFIIANAVNILRLKPVQRVIESTYSGLFVDEYQDCTVPQHCLINGLSEILPTRILGDPLQGIFGFNGDTLVNMADAEHMGDFLDRCETLQVPWRWHIPGGNTTLGESLKELRRLLLASQPIDISTLGGIEFHRVPEADLYEFKSHYYRTVSNLLNERNVLVIHPESSRLESRVQFLQRFQNRLLLIESIDSKDLYVVADFLDRLDRQQPIAGLITALKMVYTATSIDTWFSNDCVKRKRSETDQAAIAPIKDLVSQLEDQFSYATVEKIFKLVKRLPQVKCYRIDLLNSICIALTNAHIKCETVLTSMQAHRNLVRRSGRSVEGKCLGTTLLTKGLEFEIVVVIDAHKLKNREHLYVALTRASRRLIVFANTPILAPYPRMNTKAITTNPTLFK